ncbi:MAG: T9SS type A sorting domain-containing protein, partial [Burkholderiales bacterium]|nr:T9SS type A sorting domain-containing protein [Bacteroidia bacterium]
RLLPNGTLDTSFNGQGYLTFNFGTNNSILYNVSTQSDGKILVCGNSGSTNSTVRPFFAVARITTNGVLDATFGNSGIILTAFNINTSSSIARCMAVQPNGKIVVGGVTPNATTQANSFALVRLNPNGTVDTTFGTDGKVTTSDINSSDYGITKLLVQPDGKIFAGAVYANSGRKMAMLRYLPNGLLDSTFGTSGFVATNESSYNCSVAIQADGKFILAGGFVSSFKFFRYTAAGVLDTSFANNANVFPATYGEASTVLIQTDQKIVVCGSTYTSDIINSCAAVIRLNNDVLGTEGFATNEVGVFPNPVQDELTISNEETMQYELFTILGAKIQAGSLAVHGQVDCSGLAKGLYLLKLNKDNGESKVVKVVKD